MITWVARFLDDETGPTSVEYAALLGAIGCVCIAAATLLGTDARRMFLQAGGSDRRPGGPGGPPTSPNVIIAPVTPAKSPDVGNGGPPPDVNPVISPPVSVVVAPPKVPVVAPTMAPQAIPTLLPVSTPISGLGAPGAGGTGGSTPSLLIPGGPAGSGTAGSQGSGHFISSNPGGNHNNNGNHYGWYKH